MRRAQGFTIVELLIVIVVIGILAALVLNSFSGAQAKARNTQTLEAAKKFTEAVILYATENGGYPGHTRSTNWYVCVGESYPDNLCSTVSGSASTMCSYGGVYEDATFNGMVRPYLAGDTLPQPSTQRIQCDTRQAVGAYYQYIVASGWANIIYWLEGDVGCVGSSGHSTVGKTLLSGNTVCNIAFKPL